MKWTKRDIKTMTGAITSFYVVNRPISGFGPVDSTWTERFRTVLADQRQEIVTGGVTNLLQMVKSRSVEYRAAAAHYRANPGVYGDADKTHWDSDLRRRVTRDEAIELVAVRFDGYAAECDKDVAKADKLLARIALDGLPPEVMTFDPTREAR